MKGRLAIVILAVLPQLAAAGPRTARQILEEAKIASGGSAWNSVRSLKMTGTLDLGGMSGRLTSYQSLSEGKFRNDLTVGPLTQSTGFDGRTGWTLDSNGDVAPHDSPSERREDRTKAYIAARDYWFPGRWGAVIARAGTVLRGKSRYAVLRVAPEGGFPFKMWIDAATRRISRIILEGRFNEEEISYGDYRRVDGLLLPFRVSVTAGRARHGQTIMVSRVAVNPSVRARFYEAPREQLAGYSFTSNAHSASVPFRYIGDHIYFPVEIAGHRFQFGLDTGGMNIISSDVAKAIGARTEGLAQATGVGKKRVAVRFARLPAVSLDSKLTLRRQLFVVVPLSGISAVEGTPLDGVLGYELFKRFVVRIDYAKHRLQILQPAGLDASAAGRAVPFTFDGRMPQVAGSLDGLAGRFDVDTGSRVALSINSPFVKAHRLLDHYRHTARTVIGWGAGGASYGRLARARELRMGGLTVRCPVVELSAQSEGADAERSVAGVIGNGILSRFTVTFDYAKQLVYLRPNESVDRPFNYDRAGMWVIQRGRSFVVQSVMSSGPAQRAGLRSGDSIVSIDGEAAARMRLADFRRLLAASAAGTKVDLRVARAGAAHPVVVTLRDLVPPCGGPASKPRSGGPNRLSARHPSDKGSLSPPVSR